jgi:hypothetical protein
MRRRSLRRRLAPAPPAPPPPASRPAPEPALTQADRENLDRARWLARVDVTDHNAGTVPPDFGRVVSQTPTTPQFSHPDYVRWAEMLGFTAATEPDPDGEGKWVDRNHRKVWEWVYILQAAHQHGALQAGGRAVGFGVGNEPLPAALAAHGLSVIATDLMGPDAPDSVQNWSTTGQLLSGIEGLLRPDIVANERAAELIRTRSVDMNEVPDDLGPCDLIWSAGSLEHLGSPGRGMQFVKRTAELLSPGGVAVHTTELDLVPHEQTVDYGELACYQPRDLRQLAAELTDDGFEIELNLHVSLDAPPDRWVSVIMLHGPELAAGEFAHLKVAAGDSVITSVGLIVGRPHA